MKITQVLGYFAFLNSFFNSLSGKVIIPGDVVVVGLFGVYEPNGEVCSTTVDVNSVTSLEAVKWYIQHLNELGGLPFKIGFEYFETCWLNEQAALHAVDILNRAQGNETIIGVIGPESSPEAETISHILGAVPYTSQLVQVSFSATAPGLSDRYPNFVRVVPNDDLQIEMMIKSMKELEWNRIATVYEDNIYGQDLFNRLKSRTETDGICISLSRAITTSVGLNVNEISKILEDAIIGIPQLRPPINGIVLLVAPSVTKAVMSWLHLSKYSSFPVIMLSGGANLDDTAFRRFNGDVISKAKGTLILAPPYRDVTEFTQYWNSIFKNATKFSAEAASNPLLWNVFYKITNCVAKNCNFNTLTDSEIMKAFRQKPVFVSYAATAAHALIKAMTSLRIGFCAAQPTSCSDFLNNFQPGDIAGTLKGMEIDFKTDFSWRPSSLLNNIMTIDDSGEVTMQDNKPAYELFNVQSLNSHSDDIKFEKIGELTNNEAVIDFNKIRDYDEYGKEVLWPDIRKAQCPPGQRCSECIPLERLQDEVLHEPGDIYVVGVVSVFQKSGVQNCGVISDNSGYQLAESIRFAVQKVNTKTGDFSNFFPGTKIGSIIINSCMSQAVAQRKIYELSKGGVRLENGTVIDLKDKIIGFIAEYTSTVSIAVAETLSILQFVQISYASTSPALSDRRRFPYFMRVVTPDDAQARAMVEIIKKINADYIQIVYSAGAYGEDGRDKVKEAAKLSKICVIQDIAVEETDSEFLIYNKLRKFAQARVVITFLYPSQVKQLIAALTTQMTRGEFVFIGSETWARDISHLAVDTNHMMLGSLTVSLEMYQDRELRSHAQKIKSKPFHVNPWAQMFVQAKRDCYFDLGFDKTLSQKCSAANDFSIDPDFTLDTYDTQAFVATKCLLTGADAFLKSTCGTSVKTLCSDFTSNTKGLVDEILKTRLDLDGSGSKMKVFDSNGDGNVGYRIFNIQKDEVDLSKLVYREVGRYPLEGTFTFETDRLTYPSDKPVESKCPNEQACASCLQGNGENGEPHQEPSPGGAKSDTAVIIVLAVFLGLIVLVCVVLAMLLWKLRRNRHDADNNLYLKPRVQQTGSDLTLPREEACTSKVYFEINNCSQERRYTPIDK